MYLKFNNEDKLKLINQDSILGSYILEKGPIKRLKDKTPFYSLVRSIVGQQISSAAQKAIMHRLEDLLVVINADNILNTSPIDLKKAGLSDRKLEYILDLSSKVKTGELNLDRLIILPDEEVISELIKIKGIGRWTAEVFLLFALNRKNIMSYDDLGIKRGIKKLYNKEEVTKEFFEELKKRYSPYNSIASLYIWEAGREKDKTWFNTTIGYFGVKYHNNILYELNILKERPNYKKHDNDFTKELEKEINEYLLKRRKKFNVKYKLEGTDFQLKVWKELLKIPYGEVRTYKDIAIKVNNPKGYRAVGLANNKNPISIIIPCHRVIGSNDKLVGYASGLDIKEKLLKLEQENK